MTYFHAQLPIWLVVPMGSWLIAWHSSLQHELLHGHPTRWQSANRAIGFVPLSLWLPYDVYRSSHLVHHHDETLTNPLLDPESYYWAPKRWSELGPVARLIVCVQTTLIGRLTLGPAWNAECLIKRELASARANVRSACVTWGTHLVGCALILTWVVGVSAISPWFYLFGFLYPGISLSLVRSFAEHRASQAVPERTAIVENARILGLLFLFNNLHVVHHEHPHLPWYRIPGWYQKHRETLIERNGVVVYDTYFDVMRRFLFKPHDDPVHARNCEAAPRCRSDRGSSPFESITRLHRAWCNPGLIMGQACGCPVMKQLINRARIVATPIYTSRGCETFRHSSLFIVNANAEFGTLSDLRGRVCAVNGFDSNTGMNLLRAAIAPLAESKPFFHSVVVTGSHLASVEMIANRGADVAAIDCVSLAHLQRFESTLTARVRQIGQSTLVPAPPFITTWKAEDRTLTVLRRALDDVTADPKLASVRTALTIGGFEYVAEADYEITLRIEQEAAAVGYPKLC
jgi:fatty acid desaturase/ABC-type phosphate/phosphonate transport system substrate-binding protein